MERMTSKYDMNVKARPARVPLGMDLLGFFKSPDILAPLSRISNFVVCRVGTHLRKDTTSSGEQNAEEVLETLSSFQLTSRSALCQSRCEIIL